MRHYLKKALNSFGFDHRDLGDLWRNLQSLFHRARLEMRHRGDGKRYYFLDVGSSGTLIQPYLKWKLRGKLITSGIDVQSSLLRNSEHDSDACIPDHNVLLSDREELVKLNFTEHLGCSSIFKASEYVKRFTHRSNWFNVVGTKTFSAVRYDQLVASGIATERIDFLKIDVQGYELKVLHGFGGVLEGINAIEIECHYIPMYDGESTFETIRQFLVCAGFILKGMKDSRFVDQEMYEFDAYFVNSRSTKKSSVQFFELINGLPLSNKTFSTSD